MEVAHWRAVAWRIALRASALRATGYGLRATGYGLRATGLEDSDWPEFRKELLALTGDGLSLAQRVWDRLKTRRSQALRSVAS